MGHGWSKCKTVGTTLTGGRICACIWPKLKKNLKPFTDPASLGRERVYYTTVDGVKYSREYTMPESLGKLAGNVEPAVLSAIKLTTTGGISAFRKHFPLLYPNVNMYSVEEKMNRVLRQSGVSMSSLPALPSDDGKEEFVNMVAQNAYGGAYELFKKGRKSSRHGGGNSHSEYDGACACGSYIGSAEDPTLETIKEYANSNAAKSKEELISQIFEAAKRLGLKFEGADLGSKIKNLIGAVPKATAFKTDEVKHTSACVSIAKAINEAFGNEVVSLSLPMETVCQQVAEILASLASGVHTEFLFVLGDVQNILNNLLILKAALDQVSENVEASNKTQNDSIGNAKTHAMMEAHRLITTELDRQVALLRNLLSVAVIPQNKNLGDLLKAEDKNRIGVFDMKTTPGDREFGKVLNTLLRGMGTTAYTAHVVDKALKTVGMKVDEYAKTNSIQELKERVLPKLLEEKDNEKTHVYLEAINVLVNNLYRSPEITKAIENKSGSHDNISTPDYHGSGEDLYPKTATEVRITDRKKLRGLVFGAFYRQVNELFNKFVSTLGVISSKVGTEVPLSDQLDGFRSLLQKLNLAITRKKEIYYALIGYYNDAMSKSHKDMFMMDLRMIGTYLDSLIETPAYKSSANYFSDLKGVVSSIVALVDKYSDEIQVKFGSAEFSGGAEDLYEPESIKYRSTKSIGDALREFDYRYRISQIRINLARESKELEGYAEKYEKLTAAAIASYVNNRDMELEKVRSNSKEGVKVLLDGDLSDIGATTHVVSVTEGKKEKEVGLDLLQKQRDVRKKFWATVEAVDMYMRVFTNAIVNNPNDVKDIKSMLEDIETINDWYSNSSGNALASVFDFFPSELKGTGITHAVGTTDSSAYSNSGAAEEDFINGSEHYYQKYSVTPSTAPGNPHIVVVPTRGKLAMDRAKQVFSGMTALKNLLSVFVHVGAKFGGEEIRKKVFMTPAQMYNNLIEYISCSAFCQGFNDTESATDQLLYDTTKNTVPVTVGEVAVGVAKTSAALSKNDQPALKRCLGIWMRSVNPELRNDNPSNGPEGYGHWKEEDTHFVLVLKSIAAKIFTVVGTYDVFDRPHEYNGLTPIRMILGGNPDAPKVDEQAVALYLRMPLLCQFYRELFGFDRNDKDEDENDIPYGNYSDYGNIPTNDAANLKITMVPDMDGTFSGLIRLIFRKTSRVSNQTYSDVEITEIIKECNMIYQRSLPKHPNNTILEIINDLVAEVNRRYGIVAGVSRDKYNEEFGQRAYATKAFDRYNNTSALGSDYALLPGEEDLEIERPGPSQRMLQNTIGSTSTLSSAYNITSKYNDLVRNFRCRLDTELGDQESHEYSFNHSIKSTQLKLKAETNDQTRFKMVCQLIRGEGIFDKADSHKYALFHETVVSGLSLLSGVHTLLARFQKRALLLDVVALRDRLITYLNSASAINMDTTVTEVYTALVNGDKSKVFHKGDLESLAVLQNVFGRYEASIHMGGQYDNDGGDYRLKQSDGIDGDAIPRDSVGTFHASTGTGVSHVINGMTTAEFEADSKKPFSKQSDTIKVFWRYMFSREYIMKELLEAIYGLSSDLQGLVTVSVDNKKIYLSWEPLKSLVEEMFSHVSKHIELLRPHVSKNLVEKYTLKQNPGSFYWLQEQLMEKIIVGTPMGGNSDRVYVGMDDLMRKLSNTYTFLTQEYNVCGKATGTNLAVNSNPSPHFKRNQFDKVLAEMIFYDASKRNSELAVSNDAPTIIGAKGDKGGHATTSSSSADMVDFMSDPYEALHLNGPLNSKILDTRTAARFKQLYSFKDEFTFNRSCLFAFNQLVAKYIQCSYDTASQRIYTGSVGFANGIFNRAVMDIRNTYPDIVPTFVISGKERKTYDTTITHLLPFQGDLSDKDQQDALSMIKRYGNDNNLHPMYVGLQADKGKNYFGCDNDNIEVVLAKMSRFEVFSVEYLLAKIANDSFHKFVKPTLSPPSAACVAAVTALNTALTGLANFPNSPERGAFVHVDFHLNDINGVMQKILHLTPTVVGVTYQNALRDIMGSTHFSEFINYLATDAAAAAGGPRAAAFARYLATGAFRAAGGAPASLEAWQENAATLFIASAVAGLGALDLILTSITAAIAAATAATIAAVNAAIDAARVHAALTSPALQGFAVRGGARTWAAYAALVQAHPESAHVQVPTKLFDDCFRELQKSFQPLISEVYDNIFKISKRFSNIPSYIVTLFQRVLSIDITTMWNNFAVGGVNDGSRVARIITCLLAGFDADAELRTNIQVATAITAAGGGNEVLLLFTSGSKKNLFNTNFNYPAIANEKIKKPFLNYFNTIDFIDRIGRIITGTSVILGGTLRINFVNTLANKKFDDAITLDTFNAITPDTILRYIQTYGVNHDDGDAVAAVFTTWDPDLTNNAIERLTEVQLVKKLKTVLKLGNNSIDPKVDPIVGDALAESMRADISKILKNFPGLDKFYKYIVEGVVKKSGSPRHNLDYAIDSLVTDNWARDADNGLDLKSKSSQRDLESNLMILASSFSYFTSATSSVSINLAVQKIKKALIETPLTTFEVPKAVNHYAKYEELTKDYTPGSSDLYITSLKHIEWQICAARSDPITLAKGATLINSIMDLDPINYSHKGSPGTDPDSLANIQKFGERWDPDGEHVLFTSLSVILKTLTTSRQTANQQYVHMFENIADVPEYVKERLRANLPALRNHFHELRARCEFIKLFVNRQEVNLYRGNWSGLLSTPKHNPWPYVLKNPVEKPEPEAVRVRYTGILDTIIRGCSTIASECDKVCLEIGSDSKYFDTFKNSIKEFKAQYGVEPFMPLSATLRILQNTCKDNAMELLPVAPLGDTRFKFMYGVRDLLQEMKKIHTLENNIGFGQIVEHFNLLADSKFQMSKGQAEAYLKTFSKLARYIYGAKHIKGILTTHNVIPDANGMNTNQLLGTATAAPVAADVARGKYRPFKSGAPNRGNMVLDNIRYVDNTAPRALAAAASDGTKILHPYDDTADKWVDITNKSDISMIQFDLFDTHTKAQYQNNKNRTTINSGAGSFIKQYLAPAYSVVKPLNETISLVENSKRENAIKLVVKHMLGSNEDHEHRQSIQNVIDLNIVPISVHALMREVPLANLYNYGYTYDRLVTQLYYQGGENKLKQLCDENNHMDIGSARDALVALLLDPYYNQHGKNESQFNLHVRNMLLGAANAGELGRPKFLSDQIYGKAIFGDLFNMPIGYKERVYNPEFDIGVPMSKIYESKKSTYTFVKSVVNSLSNILTTLTTKFVNIDNVDRPKFLDSTEMVLNNQLLTLKQLQVKVVALKPALVNNEYGTGIALISLVGTIAALHALGLLNRNVYQAYDEFLALVGSLSGVGDGDAGILAADKALAKTNITAAVYAGNYLTPTGGLGGISSIATVCEHIWPLLIKNLFANVKISLAEYDSIEQYHTRVMNLLTLTAAPRKLSTYTASNVNPTTLVVVAGAGTEHSVARVSRAVGVTLVSMLRNGMLGKFDANLLEEIIATSIVGIMAHNAHDGMFADANSEPALAAGTKWSAAASGDKLQNLYDLILASITKWDAGRLKNGNISDPSDIIAAITKFGKLKFIPRIPSEGLIKTTELLHSRIAAADVDITLSNGVGITAASPIAINTLIITFDGIKLREIFTKDRKSVASPPMLRTETDGILTYVPSDHSDAVSDSGKYNVKKISVTNGDNLAINGQMRFDTVLIRNIVFIVNLYRSVRMKLQRDLNYSKDIILRSAPITRTELTEFHANQTWRDRRSEADGYDDGTRATSRFRSLEGTSI